MMCPFCTKFVPWISVRCPHCTSFYGHWGLWAWNLKVWALLALGLSLAAVLFLAWL